MESPNLNIQIYKKPSPLKPIMLFLIGVIVGAGLTYIFFNFFFTPSETKITPPSLPSTPLTSQTLSQPPSPEKKPPASETSTMPQFSIDRISPFIITLDMDKYTNDILTTLNKVKPLAIKITSSSNNFNPDKFTEISKNIFTTLQKENQGLPLIAVDSEILFTRALPQFESLPTIPQLREETDPNKITETAKNYAELAKKLGINIIIGPMIELFVTGKSDETQKELYFSDAPEIIQLAGISFIKGLAQGKVIPVVKTFPAKTIAEKKEVDGRVILTLDPPQTQDTNQAISMLATWLFPFSESAHEGAPAILISHTAIPILEPESPNQPCTTSEKIIKGLIREKWNYDGLLIAEDIMEYPLATGESYTDIALKIISTGIDLISISLTDETELLKISELIKNNLSEEYKQKINSRISTAIANIQPIEPETKDYQTTPSPPQPEQTLIAKEETISTPTTSLSTDQQSPPTLQPEKTTQQTTEQTTHPEEKPAETPSPQLPEPISSPPPTQTTPTQPPIEKSIPTTEKEKKEEKTPPPIEPTTISQTSPIEQPSNAQKTIPQTTSEPQPEKPTPPLPTQLAKEPKLPKPTEEKNITSQPTPQQKDEIPTSKPKKITPPPNTKPIIHKISQGETLFSIARKYGVTPKEIITWNNIDNPNLIKYGLKLTIYLPETATTPSPPAQQPKPIQPTKETTPPKPPTLEPISIPTETQTSHPPQQPQPSQPTKELPSTTTETPQPQPTEQTQPQTTETTIYTVKHGDTLESIARDFRTTKEEIIQLNNLKKPYILPAGRKLKVPKVPKVSFNQ